MRELGVFVDINNLYINIARKYKGRKLNYSKYLEFHPGNVGQAIAYGSQKNNEAETFIDRLKNIGFLTKYHKYEQQPLSPNVELTIDVMQMMERLDVVVIGSSDPNLRELLRYLRQNGLQSWVFASRIHDDLRQHASYAVEIPQSLLE